MADTPTDSSNRILQDRFNQDINEEIQALQEKIKELEARIVVLEP